MIDYINRHLKDAFLRASAEYPAILLTGPRQTGKTTLLKRLMDAEGRNRTYVSLDDYDALTIALGDPVMFFQTYKPPLLIDEVQYAPGLFTGIKRLIDKGAVPGDFWMTGSQLFKMMKGVQESLAGRLALFHLSPLSQQEIFPNFEPGVFKPDYQLLLSRQEKTAPLAAVDIYERIFRGSMPALISGKFSDRDLYYSSYVKTYLERDIRDIASGIDFLKFTDFIRAAAARTAQLINYKHIADDAGINQETAKSWLQLLETLGIIFFVRPYHHNTLKRMIKTPKLYFYDTGFAVFLTKWNSPETLMNGAMNGAFLENYVTSEIIKGCENSGKEAALYFYRDKDSKEIDLLLESDGMLEPVEIKKTASPSKGMISSFAVLERPPLRRGTGALICLAEHLGAFDSENLIVPVGLV
ncbi:MAG: ATP-binding protein [Treponema sp.]|jgi:predicted AAA+ superfamily ATPase|nr:ATP-binding protein [Treponema sp.]